jgi:Protein of unknown function (DUF3800)
VRIAYFDEAGTANELQEPFLVVGGVLIHGDTEWHPIEVASNEIIASMVPPELRQGFFFRATRLHGDHKSYKGVLSSEQRLELLRQLVNLIAQFKLPISYGAITRAKLHEALPSSKSSTRTHIGHQIAFSLCAFGFQGWFSRGPFGDEVVICVADKNDVANRQLHLKQTFAAQRAQGLPDLPMVLLMNFVDALHFASSSESIGLQLADVAAFVIKRHLMGKEDTDKLYKTLEPLLVCDPESALWPIS